jgi:hypothetical protein
MNLNSVIGQSPNINGLGINGTLDNPISNPINLNANNTLNMDLNVQNKLNGLGTEINMPEGGLKLDGNINNTLQSPNINLNNDIPNLNINNQIGLNTPEIKLDSNLPKLNATSPITDLPNLDIKGSIPNLNTNLPNISSNTNINTNLPGLNTNLTPLNMDLNGPNINTNGIGINMDNDDNGFFEMSGIIKGTNEVNNGNLNLASGGININQNMTLVNPSAPKLDLIGSNLNANSNVTLGGVINNTNIILPSNNVNINENINLPKINITDSKIGGNFNGDLKASLPQDLNNNNYGMNVNIETSNTGGYGINIGQK